MRQQLQVQLDPVVHAEQNVLVLPLRARARHLVVGFILVAIFGIFILDQNLPLGVATGVLYVPVILVSLFVSDSKVTAGAAALATLLTWLAFFTSENGNQPEWAVLMNRIVSCIAIWSVAVLSLTSIRQGTVLNAEKLANSRLTRSNSELEAFASIASHDLQAPVRKVIGFCERLQDSEPPLDERQGEFVSRIQVAAERMRELLTDLLTYSRVSTAQRNTTTVDLNDCVSQVLDDLSEAISSSGAKIEVGQLPAIEADHTQMLQLFLNLIGNAIKYRRDDVLCVVKIDAVETSRTNEFTGAADPRLPALVEITVADNGVGFDLELTQQIFDIFTRLHGPEDFEGTGIGLSICRRIVEKHHGQIRVGSTVGVGSEFTLILPTKQPELRLIAEEAA